MLVMGLSFFFWICVVCRIEIWVETSENDSCQSTVMFIYSTIYVVDEAWLFGFMHAMTLISKWSWSLSQLFSILYLRYWVWLYQLCHYRCFFYYYFCGLKYLWCLFSSAYWALISVIVSREADNHCKQLPSAQEVWDWVLCYAGQGYCASFSWK
jgi:hypothetical protein